MLTNPEVIAVDQHSTGNHPVITTDKIVVWVANSAKADEHYLAIFNLGEAIQNVRYSWKDLEFPAGKYRVRDLWERKDLGSADSVSVILPPHGSVLYGVSAME